MIETTRGVDTTFLIELEIVEAEHHQIAHAYLRQHVIDQDSRLALCPQVLLEFIHIVTDPRRFERPLSMEQARIKAELWWHAEQVRHVFPNHEATALFLRWIEAYRLGRKRLLDTMLAATYQAAGIGEVITSNARDFSVFEGIISIVPNQVMAVD